MANGMSLDGVLIRRRKKASNELILTRFKYSNFCTVFGGCVGDDDDECIKEA